MPVTTIERGSFAIFALISRISVTFLSNPLINEPPPANEIPWDKMSPESSGGVFSKLA